MIRFLIGTQQFIHYYGQWSYCTCCLYDRRLR